MNDLLANSYFKDFLIPLLAVVITIGVKFVSRRDTFMQFEKEDFNIGFDLIVSSLILLITYSSKIALEITRNNLEHLELYKKKLEILPWILLFSTFGLWGLSTIVRLYGWENNQTKTLKTWPGVVIPAIIGVISLLFSVSFVE